MEVTEQAQPEIETTSVQEPAGSHESIGSIYRDALKGKAGSPEDSEPTEEDQSKEQPAAKPEKETVETLFGKITLDEAKEIAFKNEEEFRKFVEKNPLLKEGLMLKSDYTRKRQAEAEEAKKFAETRKQFEAEQVKQSE